jgi:hypothetical protein
MKKREKLKTSTSLNSESSNNQGELLKSFEKFKKLNSSEKLFFLGRMIASDTDGPPTEYDTVGGGCDTDPGKCDDDPDRDSTGVPSPPVA